MEYPLYVEPLWKLLPAPARMQQLATAMADWKQITARIRRAKGSKDPAGQLSNLFQKTRDAMVAFEFLVEFLMDFVRKASGRKRR